MIPKETTPRAITPAIAHLARKLGACAPQYVPVQPSPDALLQKCYPNVGAYVRANGGEPVEGWLVWEETGQRWLLAIHHCVWRSPTGCLIDITPHADGEPQIVFCPGGPKWDGVHQVAGVYEPLVADRTVQRLCAVGNELQRWSATNTTVGKPVVPDMRSTQLSMEQMKLLAELSQETVADVASALVVRLVGKSILPALGLRLSGDHAPPAGAPLRGRVARKESADSAERPTARNERGQFPGTGPDPRGLTGEARSWRRHLLAAHAGELNDFFRRSGDPDAVGFTIDITEGKGRVMGKFLLAAQENLSPAQAEGRVSQLIQARRRQRSAATINLVVPFEAAKLLVAPFNPNSVRNLEEQQRARPRHAHVVVAVGGHGKTYGYLVTDGPTAPDACHRIDTSWADRLSGLGWGAGVFEAESAHDRSHGAWAKKAQERARKKVERRRKKR